MEEETGKWILFKIGVFRRQVFRSSLLIIHSTTKQWRVKLWGRERETLINHTRKRYICVTSHESETGQGHTVPHQSLSNQKFETKPIKVGTKDSSSLIEILGLIKLMKFQWQKHTTHKKHPSTNRQPTNFFNEFKTYTIHYFPLLC